LDIAGNYHLPTDNNDIAILRALPQVLGGLGILAHSGIAGQQANILSRRLTKQFVSMFCKFLKPRVQSWGKIDLSWENYLRTDDTAAAGVVTDRPHINNCFISSENIEDNTDLKPLMQSLYQGAWEILLQKLNRDDFKSKAAWLLSSNFKGSGSWLAGRGHKVFYGEFELKGETYREALRMRLLLPPVTAHTHEHRWAQRKCTCGRELKLGQDPFHLLDCAHGQWYFTRRHDAVKLILAKHIEKSYPDGKVVVEEVFTLDSGKVMKADITLRFPGSDDFYVIDVSIVEPAAPSYVKCGSNEHRDAANNAREQNKISKYEILRNKEPAAFRFVPFVIEATGRLGIHGRAFLGELFTKQQTTKLMMQIGAKIMKFNASMMRQMYTNMEKAEQRPIPINVPQVLPEDDDTFNNNTTHPSLTQ
jgi:hypothetical protein